MPVFVEVLGPVVSAQDQNDLLKIYADAPEQWQLTPERVQALVVQGVSSQGLLGARFNGRLLGAGFIRREPGRWFLSHLCVRAITRRRGVGQRLVDEGMRLALQAQATLYWDAPEVSVPQPLADCSLGGLIRL